MHRPGRSDNLERWTRPDLFLAYHNWDFFLKICSWKGLLMLVTNVGDEMMATFGCWWPMLVEINFNLSNHQNEWSFFEENIRIWDWFERGQGDLANNSANFELANQILIWRTLTRISRTQIRFGDQKWDMNRRWISFWTWDWFESLKSSKSMHTWQSSLLIDFCSKLIVHPVSVN